MVFEVMKDKQLIVNILCDKFNVVDHEFVKNKSYAIIRDNQTIAMIPANGELEEVWEEHFILHLK